MSPVKEKVDSIISAAIETVEAKLQDAKQLVTETAQKLQESAKEFGSNINERVKNTIKQV